MSSVRLTVFKRQTILDKVFAYTFGDVKKKIYEADVALIHKCYRYLYSQKEIDLLNGLPNGWLSKTSHFHINAGGQHHYFYINEEDSIVVPQNANFTFPYGVDICDEIQRHAQKKQKFDEEQRAFRNKFLSFLRSFSTLKRLREEMPELDQIMGEDYFQENVPTTALVPFKDELINMISNYNPNLQV